LLLARVQAPRAHRPIAVGTAHAAAHPEDDGTASAPTTLLMSARHRSSSGSGDAKRRLKAVTRRRRVRAGEAAPTGAGVARAEVTVEVATRADRG
jgi:hypothetical protein